MRIALDARTIYWPTRHGTGKNLIDLYRYISQIRPAWRVIGFHRLEENIPHVLPEPFVEPRHIEIRGDRFDIWGKMRLPLAAWQADADILHCPANYCSQWMPVKTLVTIHDLIPLDMPEGRPTAEIKRFAQAITTACKRAAGIICPSYYTKQRLVNEFHANPELVTVNHWAADSSVQYVAPSHWQGVCSRYGIHGPFVLHFGATDPRKNTRATLQAWAKLSPDKRDNHQLLVIGLQGNGEQIMQKLVNELGIAQSVRLHGFADEQDLPTLLSAADALLFASLSEGFGLPILDAWTTRTAVLTSQCTSLPEVAGKAAVLVDPTNSNAIAQGLAKLIGNPIYRAQLVQQGVQRLKQFTWQATANRFVDAVEKAAGLSKQHRHAA